MRSLLEAINDAAKEFERSCAKCGRTFILGMNRGEANRRYCYDCRPIDYRRREAWRNYDKKRRAA